jgi:uncharacterized protein
MSMPPERPLDAVGLARSEARVERDFQVSAFSRLLDRLAEPTGRVQALAQFRQAGHWPAAHLSVAADVVLTCQRCLGPVRRTLVSDTEIVFADETAADLPEGSEVIGGDPHRLDFATLVEDELLLALPIIPQHDAGEACALPAGAGDEQDTADTAEMRRPFAGLKDLLKH